MELCRKKARRMSEAAAVTSNWSSLPRDMLMKIAELTLKASVEDFMAFEGVCRSWRAVGREDEFVESTKSWSWPRVPFLMLAEKKEGQKEREFYSLSRRKISMRIPIPEAKGNRCLESRFGWLLVVACSPENEGDLLLLNPFSGARIPLPNYKTFPPYVSYKNYPHRHNPTFGFIKKSMLSADPSHTSDFLVLLLPTKASMAFWRNGDTHWTQINPTYYAPFIDVNYSTRDHCFYVLSDGGVIFVWDPVNADPSQLKKILELRKYIVPLTRWRAYLVESSTRELLLVARNGQVIKSLKRLNYGATEFRVYQVDVTRGECKRVWSLNNDAIFVGHNSAMSIKVLPPNDAILPNRIYFSDDSVLSYTIRSPYRLQYFWSDSESDDEKFGGLVIPRHDEWDAGNIDARGGGGKDMGIYNLEDSKYSEIRSS